MAQPLPLRSDGTAAGAGFGLERPDVEELFDLVRRPAWQADALCHEHPDVDFFPAQGEPTEPARAVCAGCLVRAECLAFALEKPVAADFGIWGGTTAQGRRRMRRGEVRSAAPPA